MALVNHPAGWFSAVVASFVFAAGSAATAAWAQCACCAGGEPQHGSSAQTGHDTHAAHGPGSAPHELHPQEGVKPPSIVARPPHGGQVTAAESVYFFEVVYLPQQTRVYLYGASQEPLSARSVGGQVVMRVRGQTQDFRLPLKYVSPPRGSKEQDYLAAAVDVSRVRDGDMIATFSLEKLSDRRLPKAGFAQTFALSQERPEAAGAKSKESNQDAIARQKVCPVTGQPLGSMGQPVRVTVKGQTVFLCCRGCEQAIRKNPDKYLAKLKN